MDVVVTVPKGLWREWIAEGDLPGEPESGFAYHFWLANPLPYIRAGERVYIVAHGKLRGYAPLLTLEHRCRLRPSVGCLMRTGGAEALTIPEPIRGFQGYRYRWWDRSAEVPFPEWQAP
jgi:hypothetical protein